MPTDPDDPVLTELQRLNENVSGLRSDVQTERKGRKGSIRATRAAGAVVILVLSAWVVQWRVDEARADEQTCAQRAESRQSIRSAIDVAVDEVAIYAEVPDPEREVLRERARTRVYEALPPPDC